jgi:hypothetical protein
MFLSGAAALLKLTLWCTCGGLGVTMANDPHIHLLFKKWRRLKMVKKFNLEENEHATVIGLTQHGKTYGTIKTLEALPGPILFFNTNHTPGINPTWVEANGGNTVEQIIYALQNGYKVNYLPSDDIIKAGKQLKAIVDSVYNLGRGALKFRFVIDEVHLFWIAKSQEGKEANLKLATTSLGRGISCVWLSQRPAMVDNTLYTQSTKHIIFALGKLDESYLKGNGFPVEEIKEKTKNEKYYFVEFDQKEIKGPFKID